MLLLKGNMCCPSLILRGLIPKSAVSGNILMCQGSGGAAWSCFYHWLLLGAPHFTMVGEIP